MAGVSQELSKDEAAELMRILADHHTVPPTWNDMEEYAKKLERLQGFANPQKLSGLSVEELNEYIKELSRQKSAPKNETEQGMRKDW